MAAEGSRWAPLLSMLPLAVPAAAAALGVYVMSTLNRADVAALQTEVSDLKRQRHDDEIKLLAACSSLMEVETQFRASDQVRNLMHANELRTTSMIWQKTFPGSIFPTDNAYYPTIAQDHPTPCG